MTNDQTFIPTLMLEADGLDDVYRIDDIIRSNMFLYFNNSIEQPSDEWRCDITGEGQSRIDSRECTGKVTIVVFHRDNAVLKIMVTYDHKFDWAHDLFKEISTIMNEDKVVVTLQISIRKEI